MPSPADPSPDGMPAGPRPDPAAWASSEMCLILIGMAGAGKSRIGLELASQLDWAHLDADNLIEAAYGAPLQYIVDNLDREAFLDLEATVIQNLRVRRCVISTGGSAVYRERAIAHLQKLGLILHLWVPLPVILERIARKPDRGLVIAAGQTIESLFNERISLYQQYASFTIHGGNGPVQEYARQALEQIRSALPHWPGTG
ncbi:MAG: shikimate kinase [Deltaproteobacteria bacterium]|nr:shikimate kinase [Deltaproteobacteria bacterium]